MSGLVGLARQCQKVGIGRKEKLNKDKVQINEQIPLNNVKDVPMSFVTIQVPGSCIWGPLTLEAKKTLKKWLVNFKTHTVSIQRKKKVTMQKPLEFEYSLNVITYYKRCRCSLRLGICVKYFLSFPFKKPVIRENWDKLRVYLSIFEH